MFVLHRNWETKNVAVLGMRSDALLDDFLIKQGMLFFARLQCFRHVQRRARAITPLIYQTLCDVPEIWSLTDRIIPNHFENNKNEKNPFDDDWPDRERAGVQM